MSAAVLIIIAVAGYLIYKGGQTAGANSTNSSSLFDELEDELEEASEQIGLTTAANNVGNSNPTGATGSDDGNDTDDPDNLAGLNELPGDDAGGDDGDD